jgi:hypothetical protein
MVIFIVIEVERVKEVEEAFKITEASTSLGTSSFSLNI